MLKLNLFFIFLLSFLILYKSIFIHFGIDKVVYILIAVFIYILIIFFITRAKINKGIVWFLPFVAWGFISLIISIFNNSFFIGLLGFTAAYLFLFFWILFFSSVNKSGKKILFKAYIKGQVILAIGMAIFAIYQFFYDPSLFGVNPNLLYSDVNLLGDIITRRATSFIGSSQNLGIYLGAMCGFLMLANFGRKIKALTLLLFMAAGILSGTRAFFLFFIIFFFIYSFYYLRYSKKIFSILLIMIIGLIFFSLVIVFKKMDIETIDRIYVFKDLGTLDIWKYFFAHDSIFHYIFGEGIGKTERLVGILFGEFTQSTESYLLKLYYELGTIGLLVFLLAYFKSVYNAFKIKNLYGKTIFAILVALAVNLALTPSFAGLTMSFILWPVIIYPLFINLKLLNEV